MEVSGQFYLLAALPPGSSRVPHLVEANWSQESVWYLLRRDKSISLYWESKPSFRVVQLVAWSLYQLSYPICPFTKGYYFVFGKVLRVRT